MYRKPLTPAQQISVARTLFLKGLEKIKRTGPFSAPTLLPFSVLPHILLRPCDFPYTVLNFLPTLLPALGLGGERLKGGRWPSPAPCLSHSVSTAQGSALLSAGDESPGSLVLLLSSLSSPSLRFFLSSPFLRTPRSLESSLIPLLGEGRFDWMRTVRLNALDGGAPYGTEWAS